MCIQALARFSPTESRCCAAFDWWLLSSRGGKKPIQDEKNKKSNTFSPINFLLPLPFLSPLLFQQMSSLFLQWLALEGHIPFSIKCARPKCFECLPKDNKIHHADLRNELLLNRGSRRDKGNRGSQHGFCQYKGNSSDYTKPQGNWSNLSADKVSSDFLQTENQKSKYYFLQCIKLRYSNN